MKKVKAAVLEAPRKLTIKEFPYPQPDDTAIILEVELCGICGTDKHLYRGETKLYEGTRAETDVPFPIILGHEIVGKIVEIGKEALKYMKTFGESIKVGDRVVICPDIFCGHCYYCQNFSGFIWCDNITTYGNNLSCKEFPHLFGGWAQYMYLLPGTYIFKVPDNINLKTAVLTEPMVVTYNLDKAKEFYSMSGEGFKAGDTVVIQGVGPLGLLHVIKARILGAGDIIAIDTSDFRLEIAKRFGADYIINANKTTSSERIEQIYDLTHGLGADLVIECAGVPKVIEEGLELVRKGGMYIITGMFVDLGTISVNPHRHFCAKNIRLLGQTNHPPSGYIPTFKLIEKYQKYFPPFEELITHEFSINDANKAVEVSMDSEKTLKVVINPHI
ncbi:zinc-binding dehydrogenase [Candidatus Bipolaricaulota sp. J31]